MAIFLKLYSTFTKLQNLKQIEEVIPDTMTELIYGFICEAKFKSV